MLPAFLRPAFPDAGRLFVQLPVLRDLTATDPLRGVVLNAGCGEGSYCPWIASFAGVTVIENIDVDWREWFLAVHTDPRLRIRRGSLTALPYDGQTFDAVICTEVIEHIPDDRAAVRELARVLKPGGTLLATVPLRPAPFDPNHARNDYSEAEFRELLNAAGFDITETRVCCHASDCMMPGAVCQPLGDGMGNPLPNGVGVCHVPPACTAVPNSG